MPIGTEKFDPHHERKYARFPHEKEVYRLIKVRELLF